MIDVCGCGKNVVTAELSEHEKLTQALDAARAEIEKLRRGGRTLGQIIDKQSRELIELTDSQDVIGEDGDGDWAVVWDRLHEMKAANRTLTRQRDDARDLVVRSGIFETDTP